MIKSHCPQGWEGVFSGASQETCHSSLDYVVYGKMDAANVTTTTICNEENDACEHVVCSHFSKCLSAKQGG